MANHLLLLTITLAVSNLIGGTILPPIPLSKECENVKCENEVEFCPPGEFLVSKSYYGNKNCCNYCKPYSSLGDSCSYSSPEMLLCSPSLRCQSKNYNGVMEQSDSMFCTYAWQNYYPVKCTRPGCPTYCSCPEDQKLVKADGLENCCDQCIQLSRLGEYCDEEQPCVSELSCSDKVCKPSSKCDTVRCPTISSCPNGTYLVPQDGIERCCDSCQPFAKIGEHCDETQNCDYSEAYCNYVDNICVASVVPTIINCEGISCSPVQCTEGVKMSPDFINSCCEYCAIPIDPANIVRINL